MYTGYKVIYITLFMYYVIQFFGPTNLALTVNVLRLSKITINEPEPESE